MISLTIIVHALIATFAVAWALGLILSAATVRSHQSPPAPVAALALEPEAANHPFMKIVPADVNAPSEVFAGTGGHSAGVWVK
jgi:hypothetical protein